MTQLFDRWREWREHPALMVRELFHVVPDPWQDEILEAFPHHQRIAMVACKGPGKTACEAWLGWNFLLTRPHPKCAATSITGDNLRDNLWTEMAKWRARSPLIEKAFEWTKSRIFNREAPETWFMTARTWPRDADANKQADTLAGLHADYVLFILDESSGIPDAVMVTAEAALASCVEGHLVQGGNPTMLSGPLYRAATSERRLWFVVHVTGDPDDPKRSTRVSEKWAHEQIEKYGRDNPWVLVNVFGKFPPSSLNVLIGVDEVEEAMRRFYREFEIGNAPRVIGVDVAREGDDASVIFCRQGIQCFPMVKHRNITSTQGAGQVSRKWTDWNADAVFIDATGGFGAGWIDQLRLLGKTPVGVQFAGQAHDSMRYYNKRAEMYFDAVEWIKRGGALPRSPELLAALTQTTYSFQRDRLLLQPKEDLKVKLGYSPDEADAFVLTFAEPVQINSAVRRPMEKVEYNPFAELDRSMRAEARRAEDYDPFGA
jgi:phage terminase large subunit